MARRPTAGMVRPAHLDLHFRGAVDAVRFALGALVAAGREGARCERKCRKSGARDTMVIEGFAGLWNFSDERCR